MRIEPRAHQIVTLAIGRSFKSFNTAPADHVLAELISSSPSNKTAEAGRVDRDTARRGQAVYKIVESLVNGSMDGAAVSLRTLPLSPAVRALRCRQWDTVADLLGRQLAILFWHLQQGLGGSTP